MTNQSPFLTLKFGQQPPIYLSEKMVLCIIVSVGGLLRLLALGRWSLWTDELYNLELMPVSAILAKGFPPDQHPPLYYLLLEGVLMVGRSEWLMRLPSALAGTLSIAMMWLVGRALKRPRLGLLAATLLALAPIHIWYSREARMYGLAMLFWTAAIYFYLQLLQRDNWLDGLGLALTMSGGLYTAYPTLALWVGQMALFFLLWHLNGQRWERLLRWGVAQLSIAALFAGWWPFLQKQLERPLVFNWQNVFQIVLGAETVAKINLALEQSGFVTTLATTFQLALLAGLIFIIFSTFLSIIIVKRENIIPTLKRWEVALAILVIILFLALTLLGSLPRGLSIRRQLLVFWLPSIIPAAWAFIRLKNLRLMAVAVAFSLLLSVSTAFGPAYEDWRSTVALISSNADKEDLILILPVWSEMAFDYYYQGNVPYEGAIIAQAQDRLDEAEHVWLVVNRHPALADQTLSTKNWFRENSRLLNTYQFPLYLTIYELKFPPH